MSTWGALQTPSFMAEISENIFFFKLTCFDPVKALNLGLTGVCAFYTFSFRRPLDQSLVPTQVKCTLVQQELQHENVLPELKTTETQTVWKICGMNSSSEHV